MQMDLLALMAPPLRWEPIARLQSGHDHPEGWSAYRAGEDAEIAVTGIETLRWGKRHATPTYEINLWHSGAGWRYREDYRFTNQGCCGPFGFHAYATREAAIVAVFRGKMRSMAHCVISSWTSTAEKGQQESLAIWMIAHCPPLHFGGINLADEWEAMKAAATEGERRRLIALRAAHDLGKQIAAIAEGLGCHSFDCSGTTGSLRDPDQKLSQNDGGGGQAAIWPARWTIAGHAPGALELHIYPATGQAVSPVTEAFVSAVRSALPHIPIVEHAEGWRYPLADFTWDDERDR